MNTQLLASAIRLWHDAEAFSDAQVERTKAMFRGAFGVTGELRGFALKDGLAMFRPEDESLVYVMHSSGQTTRLVIYGKYETSKHCTCTDLALMARASCPQPRLDGLDHFFGIWRRSVSWDRVQRVLGKDEDEPIGADALARMSREAGLLGFVRKQGGSGLCLDWVDPERLKAGHAPLTFEVVGTTVHEAYGPEPLELRTWGDWNRYLISVMNW